MFMNVFTKSLVGTRDCGN